METVVLKAILGYDTFHEYSIFLYVKVVTDAPGVAKKILNKPIEFVVDVIADEISDTITETKVEASEGEANIQNDSTDMNLEQKAIAPSMEEINQMMDKLMEGYYADPEVVKAHLEAIGAYDIPDTSISPNKQTKKKDN